MTFCAVENTTPEGVILFTRIAQSTKKDSCGCLDASERETAILRKVGSLERVLEDYTKNEIILEYWMFFFFTGRGCTECRVPYTDAVSAFFFGVIECFIRALNQDFQQFTERGAVKRNNSL